MTFCNIHGIVWRHNVSNGSKSTYTGINAQNLNGLSEKVTGPVYYQYQWSKPWTAALWICSVHNPQAAVTHSSWQFLMLSRASRMTMSQCWTKLTNAKRWDCGYNCMKGVLYHHPCLLKLAQAGQLRFEDLNGVTTDLWPPGGPPWTLKRWSSWLSSSATCSCWGNLEGRLFDFMDIVFDFKLNWQ